MDGIEQADRLGRLVRLQLADQMKHDAIMVGAQRGPFVLRLLHPIFAEMTLARVEQRADRGSIMRFGHRNQHDAADVPPDAPRRIGHRRPHRCQIIRCLAHAVLSPRIARAFAAPIERLMPRRHPSHLPATWLFTDARLADRILAIAALLPPGSGIVVRDDDLPPRARWRLVRRLARIAKARRLRLLVAASPAVARRWGADGVHLRQSAAHRAAQARKLGLLIGMPVHNHGEARVAHRVKADTVFISPLYPTRSHSDGAAISISDFAELAHLSGAHPVALGGMTPHRARRLQRQLAASILHPGWAAIDAWMERANAQRQKRNCVPT